MFSNDDLCWLYVGVALGLWICADALVNWLVG